MDFMQLRERKREENINIMMLLKKASLGSIYKLWNRLFNSTVIRPSDKNALKKFCDQFREFPPS